jgi:uncharacterized protein
MNAKNKNRLIEIVAKKMTAMRDPSHDINHAIRVATLAENICKTESADHDITFAASILHDIIVYPKNHPKRSLSSKKSASLAKKILTDEKFFSAERIKKICRAIELCSFTNNLSPDFIEAKILQDADALESVGAIAIMRTFSTAGQLNRSFYSINDPFCDNRTPDDSNFALDLFFSRLLVIYRRLHTVTGRKLAKNRILFLKKFLTQLRTEI